MPVRVKPPPAEIGETISPFWASLETTIPAERGADDAVLDVLAGQGDLGVRGLHLFFSGRHLGLQALGRGSGLVERLGAGVAVGGKARVPCELPLGVGEIDLERGDRGGRRIPLGPGSLQPALRVRIVEPGQELPLGDGHALVDEDVDDPGRDLGRDRGSAARRDVAAGVQERHGRGVAAGTRFGERDDGGPAAEPEEGREDDDDRNDRPDDEAPGPPSHDGGADALVDPQP